MGNNYKTILYLTYNIKNGHIYIGVHNTINPDKFDGYIGNGVNIFHPHTIKHPSCPFHYAVKKYGFDAFKRITLKVFDTREEALKAESIIVDKDFIARDDTYNIALGGGAPPIFERIVYQYDLQGNYLNTYLNIITAEKAVGIINGITSAIKYKTVSGGYLWSLDKIEHLDMNEYRVVIQTKTIYAYDTKGNYVRTYNSLSEFCTLNKITLGPVQRAIKTKTKAAGYYLSETKIDKFVKEKPKKQTNELHQYSLSGEYITTFNSALEAYKKLGEGYSQITTKVKMGNPVCGNYQWTYEKVDKMPSREKYVFNKKIGQYTLDTNKLVKVYDTVRECRKEFGNVSRVLSGKCTQCKGYTFKYID